VALYFVPWILHRRTSAQRRLFSRLYRTDSQHTRQWNNVIESVGHLIPYCLAIHK
jgi:hypothetical protein